MMTPYAKRNLLYASLALIFFLLEFILDKLLGKSLVLTLLLLLIILVGSKGILIKYNDAIIRYLIIGTLICIAAYYITGGAINERLEWKLVPIILSIISISQGMIGFAFKDNDKASTVNMVLGIFVSICVLYLTSHFTVVIDLNLLS
ncbi:MAG: hypothetical protein ACP5OA_05870 [Candidatus Woesearchaeota archaeon]